MIYSYPKIPEFTTLGCDPDKVNIVQFWGFYSENELYENEGKLLMMDIDFGRKCTLNCSSCFRKSNPVDNNDYRDLSYEELLKVIDQAQNLGLREIKICGAGEPLENPLLLQLAKDLTMREIGLSIFTKAHVLNDDGYVAQLYEMYGIKDALTLCKEFFRLKTSFLVSFQSACAQIQDGLVGNISGYTQKRNKGLELLVEAGFNKTFPTRLAMCANPIMTDNYEELFDIYVFARKRNILPVNAALMISGKQINYDFLRRKDVSAKEKEDLFVRIYEYNLQHGYNTIEQLLKENISCMPGIHPCNQIAAGLYLTCNGNVIICPGDNGKPIGNVREQSIAEIWVNHKNWPYIGKFNCHCPFKDGITLPEGLYDNVISRLVDNKRAMAI